MPLWFCDWEECRQPAVQRSGDCLLCDKHLCRVHVQHKWHKCPDPNVDWDSYSAQFAAREAAHIDALYRKLDSVKLCSLASSLRHGIPCRADITCKTLSTMMGNQNCHAEVIFEDGVSWIAGFRLTKTSSSPLQVRDYLLQSEAATMTYLQKNTKLPTPKIFHWASESDPINILGVSYILMEKMDGEPLDWSSATTEQREKIMQQLADIFLEIDKHPFEKMGSLWGDPSQICGIADPGLFRMTYSSPLGPFSTSAEGMRAILESYLEMIVTGEIAAINRVDVYLAHKFRLDVLDKVFTSGNKFFLKHPDDKGDHILVDRFFNITGIIDWEWTQLVSKEEAFSSPCMMWPIGKFYDGLNDLADEEVRLAEILQERGRKDLGKYVLEGRKNQRLGFALGPEGSVSNQASFANLFTGLRKILDSSDDRTWQDWKESALKWWKFDKGLQILLRQSEDKPSKY